MEIHGMGIFVIFFILMDLAVIPWTDIDGP
jgi:hypothetical protein